MVTDFEIKKSHAVLPDAFHVNKLVLMYRQKPTESYYSDDYMFVDLDSSSGGYPTRATMLNAHNFKNEEKAFQYDQKGEFILAELEITGVVKVNKELDKIRATNNEELVKKEQRRQQYEQLKKEFG